MQAVLLQVRDDEAAADQEWRCFLEACGVEPQDLRCINLVHQPELTWSTVADVEIFLVGGAGSHSATQEYDFTKGLEAVVRRVVAEGRPFFGSCFGHHLLVKALGGSVVTDHHSGEVGTFEIELTPSGREDPLVSGFPSHFTAQLGHHDRVKDLPEGFIELARSQRCPFQLLRAVGKPIYSSQFHSEMTDEHLRVRLEMYRHSYLAERTTREEVSASLRPSPWADKLLRRFIEQHS